MGHRHASCLADPWSCTSKPESISYVHDASPGLGAFSLDTWGILLANTQHNVAYCVLNAESFVVYCVGESTLCLGERRGKEG